MVRQQKEITGVISALVTPFMQNGEIDKDGLAQQIEFMCTSGVSGFFIGGTTGEGAYLSTAEKHQIITVTDQASAGQYDIYAVCIQPSTRAVLSEMEVLLNGVPSYIAAVPPFYYSMTIEAIIDHYITIADASPVPLILYDIPQYTHNPISLEIIQKLSHHDNIIGIKDSTGNFIRFSSMMRDQLIDKHFIWIQGNDYLDAVSLIIGADAIVSGLSNVFPSLYVTMFNAYVHHDLDAMLKAQQRIQQLAGIISVAQGNDISAVKASLEYLHRCSRWLRTTALSASDEVIQEVGRILRDDSLFQEGGLGL